MEAIGNKGDILILITTSGNSINLIETLKVAKKKGLKIYCFSGNNGGKIKKIFKKHCYNSFQKYFINSGGRNFFRSITMRLLREKFQKMKKKFIKKIICFDIDNTICITSGKKI